MVVVVVVVAVGVAAAAVVKSCDFEGAPSKLLWVV